MAEKNKVTEVVFISKLIAPSDEIDIHGINVTNNDVLVCDVNSKRVLRYNLEGDFINSCHIDLFPRDVCKVPGFEQAAVTLQESRFSSKSGFIAVIDIKNMEIVRKGQCKCTPFGITCVSDGYAVGSWNKIELYDFDFCLFKSIDLPVDNVAVKALATTTNNNFLYCTSTLNCISPDGNIVFHFSVENGKPTGVCTLNDTIFISTNTGHILKLNNCGGHMETLIDCYECHGRLNYIFCSKDKNKLYAATDDGSSLSVFQLKQC